MGTATFASQPTSVAMRSFLGRTIRQVGAAPKHLICDKGGQFWCDGFKHWCKRRDIRPRFGAIGQHGSLAVIERFILTLKTGCTRLLMVPMRRESFRRELDVFIGWYNEHRPHMSLRGRTPNEVYYRRHPANRRPRFEPRSDWPRGSPCAGQWALVKGKPGAKLGLHVEFLAGRKHLPLVTLPRVA